MTTEEARAKIEAMFGHVDPKIYDSRSFSPAIPNTSPKGRVFIFKTFTQDGEHQFFSPVTPCDSSDEALSKMVDQIQAVSDPFATLLWRQLPIVKSDYDMRTMKAQYVATCRITWIPQEDRCVMNGGFD